MTDNFTILQLITIETIQIKFLAPHADYSVNKNWLNRHSVKEGKNVSNSKVEAIESNDV